jgi:hypothetical protein
MDGVEGRDNDLVSSRLLLDRVRLAEEHRTAELQHQQARLATVLAANTFLLALLINSALQHHTSTDHFSRGVERCLLAGILLVAAALLAGLWALVPRVPPGNPNYLNIEWITGVATGLNTEDLISQLTDSYKPEDGDPTPLDIIKTRRRWQIAQLALLGLGTLSISIASAWILH